jgi:TRAP-type C4-dicarboxylate transport system substrate-binding protein
MRPRKNLLVYVLVVLIAITFSLPCVCAAEAQKIKLSLAHIYTPKSWNELYAIPALFKLVEKQTKGKYTLDIAYYHSGTLLARMVQSRYQPGSLSRHGDLKSARNRPSYQRLCQFPYLVGIL